MTMESIASSAGVSIMTLYRHARTKEALFVAVVSEACARGKGARRRTKSRGYNVGRPALDEQRYRAAGAVMIEHCTVDISYQQTRDAVTRYFQ
jgi:AcrR family transcriptional regulator